MAFCGEGKKEKTMIKRNEITNEQHRGNDNPDMPYEKFLVYGPEGLSDRELLAIILRTGTRQMNVMQVAEEVLTLARAGGKEGLLGLHDLTLAQLSAIKGIGQVKAVRLKCLTELSMRISTTRAKQGLVFSDSFKVAMYYMEKMRHRDTECVMVVSLDSKYRLIKDSILSSGSVHMSLISPREIFLEALQNRAVNIILLHNHPSGDPTPSQNDCDITVALAKAGELIGIYLQDHIIIGDNVYTSFRELSYL
jgi:DNA repair protein RadC